jgi:HEAT repeat protein
MTKADIYRARLRSLREWDAYLLKESGLPGPRGNLELAQVVADEGRPELFRRYLDYTADRAPTNSPYEFLAFCGVVGLGRLLAEGDLHVLPTLRRFAGDPRWRLREAVAMALQRQGDVEMAALLSEMREWANGTPFEQRAAAAAVCEPRLLAQARHARAALVLLDRITASVERASDRRSDAFQALRKGLGYCWSVAVVALPEAGKPLMEKWMARPDADVRWIMRENLKKNRLVRIEAAWTKKWIGRLGR